MTATPEQLNEMVDYLMGFANDMLTKSGEFYPFAALVNSNGAVEALAAHSGEEHPQSSEIYEMLLSALKSRVESGDAIGAGIAVDVNIPPQFESPLPDGVRITLETEGNSRFVYYPYQPAKKGLFKKAPPKFAEPFAVEMPAHIFAEGSR